MQHFDYEIGAWRARASIQQVNESKLMAIICVMDHGGDQGIASQHTIVFDHDEGRDAVEETRLVLQNLLGARYQA